MAKVALRHPVAALARTFVRASSQQLTRADAAGDLSFKITGSSVAAWFRPASLATSMLVVAKDGFNVGDRNFQVGYSSINASVIVNHASHAALLGPISVNTWNLVIMWYDPADQKIYGQLNNADPIASTPVTSFDLSSGHFKIGAAGNTASGIAGFFFDGRISRVLFADQVWTPAERTWLHNAGRSRHYSDLGRAGTAGANMLTDLRGAWMTAEASGNGLDSHGGFTLTQSNGPGTAAGPP